MKVNVIAEIGSNWEGDVELGKTHIKKAKESGASHVKFQMWRAKDLYDSSHPNWDMIKKSELSEDNALELKKYADTIGITWFCSVFYPEAVDFLESINVSLYKIASRTSILKDKYSFETIQRIGLTEKPTFISTGEGASIEKIKNQFQKNFPVFTYCISNYPTLDSEIDWKEIVNYDFFSDHTLGITIPLIYLVLKKPPYEKDLFIEKHVKLDNSQGPDSSFSITYDELSELVNQSNRISKLQF